MYKDKRKKKDLQLFKESVQSKMKYQYEVWTSVVNYLVIQYFNNSNNY